MRPDNKQPLVPLQKGDKPAIELVLEVISGDDMKAGTHIPIPLHEPLPVGRSTKGLKLTDPHVSIQHARIFYEVALGCVVEDLGSATGTWVDEECVRSAARPIGVGTKLRFGDTQFEVRPVPKVPWWFQVATASLALTAIGMVSWWSFQQLQTPPPPSIACPPSSLGPLGIGRMQIPPTFLRQRRLLQADLVCSKVTDNNEDGKPEAWLDRVDGLGQYLVQPEPDGTWTLLGELPPRCSQASRVPGEHPVLDCMGETWLVDQGIYRVIEQEGVVVWYRERLDQADPAEGGGGGHPAPGEPGQPTEPARLQLEQLGPIKVGRFPLKGDGLGAFLATRGVDRPVHYLICEDAFEGVHYQALNDEEQLIELQTGCITDLKLDGAIRGKPLALALSPVGRKALVDDVTTFYAGHPDGLFLPPELREMVTAISAQPGYLVGSTRLVAETKESAAATFAARPLSSRTITTPHTLLPRDSRHAAAKPAWTVSITHSAVGQADPPGCSVLRVRTGPFHVSSFGLTKTFMTVEEVGCGEPRTVAVLGYGNATQTVQLDGVELRVVVESRSVTNGFEVASARLSWR